MGDTNGTEEVGTRHEFVNNYQEGLTFVCQELEVRRTTTYVVRVGGPTCSRFASLNAACTYREDMFVKIAYWR